MHLKLQLDFCTLTVAMKLYSVTSQQSRLRRNFHSIKLSKPSQDHITGSDGEYNGPADITFEDMRKLFTHVNQYDHEDDTYWVIEQGKWDWWNNKPQADHTYGNTSGKCNNKV